MPIENIQAIFFDMDGTLVDSEAHTSEAVDAVLSDLGVMEHHLETSQFFGTTWQSIEGFLVHEFPHLAGLGIAQRLQDVFQRLFASEPLPFVPGAPEMIVSAGSLFPTAIVTSSNRESVQSLVSRLTFGDVFDLLVSAEDYQHSKPDPECYLLAAQKLNVAPQRCLVFEDSIPGLQAAKAAGMWAVAIAGNSPNPRLAAELADLAITDYRDLPPDFLESIR